MTTVPYDPRPTLPEHLRRQVDEQTVTLITTSDDRGIWAAVDRACASETKARFSARWSALRHHAGRSELTIKGIIDMVVLWTPNADGTRTVRTGLSGGIVRQSTFMLVPVGRKTLTGVERIGSFGAALRNELRNR